MSHEYERAAGQASNSTGKAETPPTTLAPSAPTLDPVLTKLVSDPYDERSGTWFSLSDHEKLRDLPVGTKLYAIPPGWTIVPIKLTTNLIEHWKYGQFADDFNQPLAKAIRADIRALCAMLAAPNAAPPNENMVMVPRDLAYGIRNDLSILLQQHDLCHAGLSDRLGWFNQILDGGNDESNKGNG